MSLSATHHTSLNTFRSSASPGALALGTSGLMSSLCHQHCQGPSCCLPASLPSLELQGVVVTQGQDLAFGLVVPHTLGLGPWLQPVQIPLQSLPDLQKINSPTQLGVICQLHEVALMPLARSPLRPRTTEPWGAALVQPQLDAAPSCLSETQVGPDPLVVLFSYRWKKLTWVFCSARMFFTRKWGKSPASSNLPALSPMSEHTACSQCSSAVPQKALLVDHLVPAIQIILEVFLPGACWPLYGLFT